MIVNKNGVFIDTHVRYRTISDNLSKQEYKFLLTTTLTISGTNGLMGQPYDMLEHRQDMCFKLNAWQNYDTWVTMKNDEAEEMLQLFFDLLDLFKKKLNNYENSTNSGHNS